MVPNVPLLTQNYITEAISVKHAPGSVDGKTTVSYKAMHFLSSVLASPSLKTFSLLLPSNFVTAAAFNEVSEDYAEHENLLADLQRFRGRIALEENAISPWQLTSDGRHVQPADDRGIHLVGTDGYGRVVSCMRYLPHANTTHWTDLRVFYTPLASDPRWRPVLEEAIGAELERARQLNYSYVEMGGWVITKELRHSLEAMRMVATAYALARHLGGALGITTATTKHGSSSILRRLGGSLLCAQGMELPPYYDPQFGCEMELLRFDSARPGKRCAQVIEHCEQSLAQLPVMLPRPLKPMLLPLAEVATA